uniref:Uncharacterized protein n=1 Tax=Picea sitchensis TaxID=3332 RepID=A0A6B9XRD0_PICSI|nr:hypothetical protein Q903MT_gene5736 [Picea sitchensis]
MIGKQIFIFTQQLHYLSNSFFVPIISNNSHSRVCVRTYIALPCIQRLLEIRLTSPRVFPSNLPFTCSFINLHVSQSLFLCRVLFV